MKPTENGLLKSCAAESEFITQLKPVLKVLKSVLYDRPIDGLAVPSESVKEFVQSKK